MRYRTEIVIPPDRYVCLQLPGFLPEGRAVVTVVVHPRESDPGDPGDDDPDRVDIEWWDDLDD